MMMSGLRFPRLRHFLIWAVLVLAWPPLYGQFDEIGEIVLPEGASFRGVEEKDGYVYGSTSWGSLFVFDARGLSSTGPFVSVSEYVTRFDDLYDLVLVRNGDYLYALGSGLDVFDIADAGHPAIERTIVTGDSIHNACLHGDLLFASGSHALSVFTLADPSQPALLDQLDLGDGNGFSVAALADRVYVSEYLSDSRSGRLRVVDASDANDLRTIETMDTEDVAYHLDVVDGQLVAFWTSSVRLYELADPAHPVEVDEHLASGRAGKVAAGFLVTSGRLFRIVDRRLKQILSFNAGGSQHDGLPHGAIVRDDFMCVVQKSRIVVLGTPATLTFPQYVTGETGQVRNRTRVILRNAGPRPAEGRIVFRSAAGLEQAVSIGGTSTSNYEFSVEAWGTLDVETDGRGDLLSGQIEVMSDLDSRSQLEGAEVFEVFGRYVSVPAATSEPQHQVFVSVNAQEDTGVAVTNPDADQSLTLQLTLVDAAGVPQSTRSIELGPREQRAVFVTDPTLFGDYLNGRASFRGTLNVVNSEGRLVPLTALIQKKSDGSLLAVPTGKRVALP